MYSIASSLNFAWSATGPHATRGPPAPLRFAGSISSRFPGPARPPRQPLVDLPQFPVDEVQQAVRLRAREGPDRSGGGLGRLVGVRRQLGDLLLQRPLAPDQVTVGPAHPLHVGADLGERRL